ncbi:DUF3013 family protein [Fundicoccus sp. Sow4_D5]|uniref:DUF3013 family protein n=1 Tax=unclassified Fundicoccus TaxID=2761543 RepID=UPI003F908AF0
MERNNILMVVDKLIQENYFHCEWGIEWQEQRHYLEIIFQFQLDNSNQFVLQDVYQNVYKNDEVPFEVRVLIYDEDLVKVEAKHYITTVPVNSDRGIMYGELIAIIKYLKILTAEVPLKWREFMRQTEETRFNVFWNEDEFNKLRESLINTSRYSESQVFFPKTN